MTTHLSDDDLVLHYYGEMDGAGDARANDHLESCDACRASYVRLQRVMAAVDAAPVPEPAAGFERIAWARIDAALPARRRGWLSWFVLSPVRLAWVAAVAVLVVASFFAGRLVRPVAPAATTQAAAAKLDERVLLVDLGEHLDSSQRMLVELVSADGGGGDLTPEQARARQLLSANRLYRQAALEAGDRTTAAVLDELERVLVDIVAMQGKMTDQQLDEVRRRIASQELLFKVRVVSSTVRERQSAALKGSI